MIFNSKGIIFLAEMDMLITLSTQVMKTAASNCQWALSFQLSNASLRTFMSAVSHALQG